MSSPIPTQLVQLTPKKIIIQVQQLECMHKLKNENHHIALNGDRWWLNMSLLYADNTHKRLRTNLHTKDVEEARRKRDRIIDALIKVFEKDIPLFDSKK